MSCINKHLGFEKYLATEKRSLQWCINAYPQKKLTILKVLSRINLKYKTTKKSYILEMGAAQGLSLIGLRESGFENVFGIEPSPEALRNVKMISKIKQAEIKIKKGIAEKIPYSDNFFDLVIAESVLEHVLSPEMVFAEVSRVLKKRGAFYFSTTSIICPHQGEIRLFPLFSWYPDGLKKSIMRWSLKRCPILIGYTNYPALNWYSFRKVNKLAEQYGFSRVLSRWDLVDSSELKSVKSILRRRISASKLLRFLADLVVPGSTYLLIK
jgi:ubiquinone/menaquinone biosynthesis C-methylase UbiE